MCTFREECSKNYFMVMKKIDCEHRKNSSQNLPKIIKKKTDSWCLSELNEIFSFSLELDRKNAHLKNFSV